jgi:phage terminase large subunit
MKIQIPDKLQFLFRPKRYKIAFGGRGGYKTENYARALLIEGGKQQLNILCAREIQKSIEASVHSVLKRLIREYELESFYKVQDAKIIGINGTVFRFTGLFRNVSAIKSADEIDIVWVEEAEAVSEDSWRDLTYTIRKPGSEIWVTFNPKEEFAYVWQEWVKPNLDIVRETDVYEDDWIYIVKTFLEENPFASEEIKRESAKLKASNIKQWMHYFGGEVYSDYTDSIIQPEWFDAAIDSHIKLGFSPMGVRSAGFDIADTGDAKAVYQRHGSVVLFSDRWTDGELPEAIDRAFRHAEESRSEFLVYDADGMGASMKVYLANVTTNKRIQVEPYFGGGKVDNPEQLYATYEGQPEKDRKTNKDTFRNKRSQYYTSLADRFEATYNAVTKGIYTDPERLISLDSDLPHLDILKSELIKIKRIVGNNSFVQIQSKKDALKEGIKSPNDADALKMCFANPAPTTEITRIEFESEF